MGMFDYIKVDASLLPGDPPGFVKDEGGHAFQTKSVECTTSTYEIAADGQLMRIEGGWSDGDDDPRPVPFHGDVEFYDSNVVGAREGFRFTRDGEDHEWVTYRARFALGRLESIAEVERSRGPALPVSAMDAPGGGDEGGPGDGPGRESDSESLAGRTMFLARGYPDADKVGESVEVVADGAREWAVRRPDGRLGLVPRIMRGNLYETEGDARAAIARREERRRKDVERLRRLMDERMAER